MAHRCYAIIISEESIKDEEIDADGNSYYIKSGTHLSYSDSANGSCQIQRPTVLAINQLNTGKIIEEYGFIME